MRLLGVDTIFKITPDIAADQSLISNHNPDVFEKPEKVVRVGG